MPVLYEQDFASVANGTNLTAVTPTVGSAMVKHADFSGNLVVNGSGEAVADGATRYCLNANAADGATVRVDAKIKIYSATPSTFNADILISRTQFGAGTATYQGGLTPWFTQRAGIVANGSVPHTVDEIVWPNGQDVWVAFEQAGSWLRTFVAGCEALRVYVASPSVTTGRPAIGSQNAHTGDDYATYKYLRIETAPTRSQVTCFGDSLTRGQTGPQGSEFFAGFFDTYPTKLAGLLGAGETVDVVNMGIPGATTAGIVSAASATSQTSVSPDNFRFGGRLTYRTGAKNVAVVWVGTNDVVLTGYGVPKTAAALVAEIEDFCDDLAADGFDAVVVVGLLHSEHPVYGNPHTSSYNDMVDDVNALLAASSHFDRFIDLSAMGEFDDPNDTTYFSDKLHLTLAGYELVAETLESIVSSALSENAGLFGSGPLGPFNTSPFLF